MEAVFVQSANETFCLAENVVYARFHKAKEARCEEQRGS